MIKSFNSYISESKKSIDYLETLTPDQLGKLLITGVRNTPIDAMYIENLITVGVPINHRSNYGRTALHWAAWNGDLEFVNFLLSKGADLDIRDMAGQTALHLATYKHHFRVMKFLISNGADIHAKDSLGDTAWDMAMDSIRMALPELNPKE